MKCLLLLAVLAASTLMTGCASMETCSGAEWYPHDTFIGASGWPSGQIPVTTIRHEDVYIVE